MSKKRKYTVDVGRACQIFQIGYSLYAKRMNDYQIRLNDEENTHIFYDWYHTTGSLVRNKNGFCRRMDCQSPDPEDVAIFIRKDLILNKV